MVSVSDGFHGQSNTITLGFGTIDDDVDESDGFVTVTLQAGSGYQITSDTSSNSATVIVQDNDPLPEFGIAGATAATLEPDSARFRLWTTTASASPVTVRINVSQTGNVLSGSAGDTTTIMPARKRQTYFEIATEDDEVVEDNGSITVRLLADTNSPATYTLTSRTYRHSATVEVYDDDTPPTITIADAAAVVEGTDANAVFTLTTSHAVRNSRVINITVSGATSFILPDQISTSVSLTNYSLRTRLAIPIHDDEVDEPDGFIYVEISAPTPTADNKKEYEVGSPNRAKVYVSDDDEPAQVPIISIADAPAVVEGTDSSAEFTLTASHLPAGSMAINFEVSGDISYLPTGQQITSAELTFVNNAATESYTAALIIPIQDNNTDESDGVIVVTLLPDNSNSPATYTIDTVTANQSAQVIVRDDDDPPIVKPTVSISRVVDTIQEGSEASFLVRIDNAINSDLDVSIEIRSEIDRTATREDIDLALKSQQFNEILIPTQSFTNIVNISAGETTGLLIIPTHDDDIDELNSKIIATIKESEQYSLSANNSEQSDTIIVLDEDVPLLTISAEYESISEKGNNGFARFAITPAVGVVEALSVPVLINQTGEFIQGESGIETVHFTKSWGWGAYIMLVELDDDEIDEIDGRITATIIKPNDGKYRISGEGSASIVITDDDDPIISIAVDGPTTITEGEDVKFNLTARDRAAEEDIMIQVSITQTSDFVTWRIPRFAKMEAGKNSTSIAVVTIDDSSVQEEGEFTAEILTGAGYRISDQNIATLTIQDNDTESDSPDGTDEPRVSVADKIIEALLVTAGVDQEPAVEKPEISIVARNDEVAEGETIRFAIQSSLVPESDLMIEISIDSPNGSISEPSPMRIALKAGSSSHLLELATSDDDKLESNELITLTINEQPTYTVSDEAGSASVTITDNKDWQRHTEIARANSAVIPELAGRMSAQSLNQITERIQQGFTSDGQNVLQIAGNEELTGILEQSGDAVNNDALLKDTLFNNSSFAFNLLPDSTAFGSATTWGSGNQLEFQRQGIGNSSLNGEMLSSHLGLDVNINQALMAGFTGSYSDSQVDYTILDNTFKYDVQMTGLFPYIGWQSLGGDYLQAIGGIGSGTIGIRQAGDDWYRLDNSLYTVEVSGGLQLFATDEANADQSSELGVDSGLRVIRYHTNQDVGIVGGIDYRHSQAHLTLDGQHTRNFATGSNLKPTAAIGLQAMSGETGNEFGYIVEGGLAFEDPSGLTISGLGSTFFNSDDWNNEPKLQGSVAFDTNSDDLGLTIDLLTTWGASLSHEPESMWERNIFSQDASDQFANAQVKVSTEFGYGFEVLDRNAIFTPYNKIDWSDSEQQIIEFGSRIAVGSGIGFDVTGSRSSSVDNETSHQIKFSGSFGW